MSLFVFPGLVSRGVAFRPVNRAVPSCAAVLFCLVAAPLVACGGSQPPPKVEETATQETKHERPSGGPTVEQELGSIDQRAVEKKFNELQSKLETCHKKGRDRVDVLSGDVKVFLRIGKD